jgi:hypothetical protein
MTEVLETADMGRPRRDRNEPRLVDPDLVDQLIADAREQGVDVAGEGGLFAQLAKTVMERSLAAVCRLTPYRIATSATVAPSSGPVSVPV